ncbi:hypothetical protein [Mucilaginibacter sp. UYCu711]|uniref:hypothetical protein n=1 Tax=Mucilaginibacter sp. UYCu711 TaxID=3156339 RepID=UPI003D248720
MENIFGWIRRNPSITKTEKIILYFCFGAVPVSLFGLALWSNFFGPTGTETFLKERSGESFAGKVDSLYNDTRNHNERTALLSDKSKFELFPEWVSIISRGDSILKRKGSLIIEVYKPHKQRFFLNYNEVVKDWNKR